MRIKKIELAQCALPLPRPIRLGPVEIKEREFVALRLTADDGTVGDALSYPRGAPLLATTSALAPSILNSDVSERRLTIENRLQSLVNNRMMLTKAASLFDIALWDIASKTAEQPLYQLLGACRHHVPVMVVAGYYLDQRSAEDIEREISDLCDQGFSRIKMMISGTDADFDFRLIKSLQKIAGNRLSIDAHWAFRNVPEAIQGLRRIDDLGLQFIEDPFGPHQSHLYPGLKNVLRTPLASGEDYVDENALGQSLQSLEILRLDATTCGGISSAVNVLGAARLAGKAVLPHVFLPVHAQLAGCFNAIEAVELVPVEIGACPMWDLLEGGVDIQSGSLRLDQRPGAGFHLDWERVERTATETFVLGN